MKTILAPRKQSRTTAILLYGMALSLVLLAPVLGVMAAAVAAWHSLLAGSIWYMPLGLVLVLAAIAMVQSHKRFDLIVLGLLVVAITAWFRADSLQQGRLLDTIQALAAQTYLMVGVLVVILTLLVVHATHRFGRPGMRSRLIWIGLPVIMLLSITAASGSMVGRFS